MLNIFFISLKKLRNYICKATIQDRKQKKFLSILALWGIIFFSRDLLAETNVYNSIQAKSYILIDLRSGKKILSKNENSFFPPASVIKLVTAMVAYEKGNLDAWIVVPRYATYADGSRIGLRWKERYRFRDLLAALLISSTNDVARTIALHIAGSEKKFAELMTEWARTNDFPNSVFFDSSGLDDRSRSSASDLAGIYSKFRMNHFLRSFLFRSSVQIRSNRGRRLYRRATNRLHRYYDPSELQVIGKTGFIRKAGYCFSGEIVHKGEAKYQFAIMGAPMAWYQIMMVVNEAMYVK